MMSAFTASKVVSQTDKRIRVQNNRDGQSAVSLSVSLFWRENDADNPAKRLSVSFFCAGLLPVITPHPGTLHSPRWLPSSQVAKPQLNL